MTGRAAANRYARALFDVARSEKADFDRLEQELSDFVDVVSGHPPLMRALTNPAVPTPKKRAIVEQLAQRADGMSPLIARTLRLLAERDRLALLPDIRAAFERRLMDYRQVVRAEVITAIELPPDRFAALHERLQRATGRQVQLQARVDPSIIGGALTRIGSTVYDGSVTTQLERLKRTLVESAQ
jgi:F-type H+-transporting ATPase subunit delta